MQQLTFRKLQVTPNLQVQSRWPIEVLEEVVEEVGVLDHPGEVSFNIFEIQPFKQLQKKDVYNSILRP
jgi:hypothetical protein